MCAVDTVVEVFGTLVGGVHLDLVAKSENFADEARDFPHRVSRLVEDLRTLTLLLNLPNTTARATSCRKARVTNLSQIYCSWPRGYGRARGPGWNTGRKIEGQDVDIEKN